MNGSQQEQRVPPQELFTAIPLTRAVGMHQFALTMGVAMIRIACIMKVDVAQVSIEIVFGIEICKYVFMEAGVHLV